MSEQETSQRGFRRFRFVLAVAFTVLVLLFVIAFVLPPKPSPAAAALDAKLAQLRADGAPLSIEELAKAFPDPPPESDARIVLRDALAWAPRGNVSPLLPFVGGAMPPRRERISDPLMQALGAHLSNSDAILTEIPQPLTNVWLSSGWAQVAKVKLPWIEIRALEQTLALKSIYEAELGNSDKAAEALQKGFAVSATLRSDSLANTMIGVACAGIMCDAAEQALSRVRFQEQQLAEIAKGLPADFIGTFDEALIAERAVLTGFLEPLRKAHHSLSQHRLRLALWRLMNAFGGSKKPLYRDEDFLLYLNIVDEMRQVESKPFLQRIRQLERSTAHLKTNAQTQLIISFFPNIIKATAAACETKARLVALKTALAIERFRLANSNALPASLDALVPTYCSSAPRDPFDGLPFRYKRLARGYVVYSVGGDGVDNGGAERGDKKTDYDVTIIVER
jgi:hypothetical protein